MNKVAASWRGAGGCLPWPARSVATHDPPCRFPLALHLAYSWLSTEAFFLARTIFLPLLSYDCICDVD